MTDPFLGAWTGVVTDSRAGVGVATLTFAGAPSPMSGEWTFSFEKTENNNNGTMLGVEKTNIAFFCAKVGGPGPVGAAGTFTVTSDGKTMSGSYASLGCGPIDKGTLQLTKK